MGVRDAVKKLSKKQEDPTKAKVEEDEQPSPVQDQQLNEQGSPAETGRLEKLLFKFSAMLDKTEAERQEMKALYQEVDTQKETVGKMLVSLDSVVKGLPNTIDASVKASIDRHGERIEQSASKVTNEIDRQVNGFLSRFVKTLQDNFATPVTNIKNAATQVAEAAVAIEEEKDSLGLWTLLVNVLVSFLVVIISLSMLSRRLPWNLRGPTAQEQIYIEQGKALIKCWSQLPPKVQGEISKTVAENN